MDAVHITQFVDVLVEDDDLGLHALSDPGCVRPRHPSADDDHLSRPDPRDSSQQHSPAPVLPLEQLGTRLRGHPAGDLTHRSKQWEGMIVQLDGLVRDPCGPTLDQRPGNGLTRGKVQVGEEDESFTQPVELLLDRFLDLEDHVRLREHGVRIRHDLGPRLLELLVEDARADAGVPLDQDRRDRRRRAREHQQG